MRIPRVFISQPLSSDQVIELDDATCHYLGKVLRMQEGRELHVFNGMGGEYAASILGVTKKSVCIRLGNFCADNRQSPLKLELAIGISRGERMDWVLQKATELGVTRITPLMTERIEVRLSGERLAKKMAHWQQILISACEQSQRYILPELSEPSNVEQWLSQVDAELKFVLHHRDSQGLPAGKSPNSLALLIGPEGGLSEVEITQALAQNFSPLTLGPRVLRTETAPLVAISLVQYLWGDF
jgi:16S rRNA (uracil1498-N3)-methyltransferase